MFYYRLLIAIILLSVSAIGHARDSLRMATTTSTDNSGLLKVLHPPFEAQHGIRVDVIAVGTGKALRLGEQGDVDIVFVHAPDAEKAFVEAGFGVKRYPVMHNDFVIIGPENDPAGIAASADASEALKQLAESRAVFISRGDDSGTHKKEKSLWNAAGIDPGGDWYLAVGQGMGAVLKIADDKGAYALTDRGTYLAYRDKIQLKIVVEGDPALFNPYHVIMVNPEKHPHVNRQAAEAYIDYIRSEAGQEIIRNFEVAGKQLFHPDVIP